ncbi:hypothetical protein DJ508_27645 [Klebsiella michiganensis]|nr:hypothetical protein [Klebsiella michiganensis]POT75612.1 hypothetical protein C3378_17745 [Klebsiella michiganensis]PSI97895.1 hypothetical protein C6400_21635 [Klebsiella michiganensis]TYD84033.1 hypothetical protein DJ519_21100 [Klebsiella michiganensis]TYE49479.1 hypothetical protein DJ508_27645 [Klebsiella michiganensis]
MRRNPLSAGSATVSGIGFHQIFTTVFHFYHATRYKSAARLGFLAASQPLHLEPIPPGVIVAGSLNTDSAQKPERTRST